MKLIVRIRTTENSQNENCHRCIFALRLSNINRSLEGYVGDGSETIDRSGRKIFVFMYKQRDCRPCARPLTDFYFRILHFWCPQWEIGEKNANCYQKLNEKLTFAIFIRTDRLWRRAKEAKALKCKCMTRENCHEMKRHLDISSEGDSNSDGMV